jgi:hypothetical protein
MTNVAAIQVAFSAVFWIGGYRRLTTIGEYGVFAFLRREVLGVAVVSVLAIVFGVQLHNAVSAALFEKRVRAVLGDHFGDPSGSHLVDVRIARKVDTTIVRAVVRGPKAPSAEEVAAIEATLPLPPDGSALRLRVRFVEIAIVTPQGPAPTEDADDER